jgi:hypothetical protein
MPAGVSAYTALANVTLGSSATTVTFSSIGQGFRDLVLVITGTQAVDSGIVDMRINADSGSNYSRVYMEGNGSTASSTSATSSFLRASGNSNHFNQTRSSIIYNIMDYSATDKHKSLLIRTDNASLISGAVAARWASTSAITSLILYSDGFQASSTLALYGVSA